MMTNIVRIGAMFAATLYVDTAMSSIQHGVIWTWLIKSFPNLQQIQINVMDTASPARRHI